jgi:hypothetical protein
MAVIEVLLSDWEKGCGSGMFPEPFPFMGKEQTTNETPWEQREDIPRWQEIRQQRLEDELKEKEHLDRKISEYLRIVEFGKNVEEESGAVAAEDTNGECGNPNRTVNK